jgi:hypothetical protein
MTPGGGVAGGSGIDRRAGRGRTPVYGEKKGTEMPQLTMTNATPRALPLRVDIETCGANR